MSDTGCLFGVNLPWFFGAYGHDLAPTERHPDWGHAFDAFRAYRPLVEARALGLRAVRVWLCEAGEGIVTGADGAIEGVRPELIESLHALEDGARIAGVRVQWTLLDGNAAREPDDRLTRAIVREPSQRARFAEHVAARIARELDPRVATGLEVLSSPEALCDGGGEEAWAAVARMARMAGDAIRAEKRELAVTVGTAFEWLRPLWRGEPALDAVDVHAYSARAWLPSRAEVADATGDSRVRDGTLPLIAGECGLPDGADAGALTGYVSSATEQGYAAAFLWRLEGTLIDATSPSRATTDAGRLVKQRLEAR